MQTEQADITLPFHTALIVDDHPLFCDALCMTVQAVAGVEETRTAASLSEALAGLKGRADKPDLILLDLNLPDVQGFDGLLRLRAAAPDVPVIVVSSMADSRIVSAALSGGATGFVPKHSTRDIFRLAFAEIAAGRTYRPEGHVDGVDSASSDRGTADALSRLSSLTGQQARILDLICEGLLNKQIAHELSIAETTVKAHVTAIMRKLGVQNRTQAVLIAQEAAFERVLPSERNAP